MNDNDKQRQAELNAISSKVDAEIARDQRDEAIDVAADIAAQRDAETVRAEVNAYERDVESVRADLNAVDASAARAQSYEASAERAQATTALRYEREQSRTNTWLLSMGLFLLFAVLVIGGMYYYDRTRRQNDQLYSAQDRLRAEEIKNKARNEQRPQNTGSTVIVTPPATTPPVVVRENPAPPPNVNVTVESQDAQQPAENNTNNTNTNTPPADDQSTPDPNDNTSGTSTSGGTTQ